MKYLITSLLLSSSFAFSGDLLEQPIEVTPKEVIEGRTFDLWAATRAYAITSYDFKDDQFGGGVRLSYDINPHRVRVRADYVSSFDDFANGSNAAKESRMSLALIYPVEQIPGLQVYTISGAGVSNFANPIKWELVGGFGIEYDINAWHIILEAQYASEEKNSSILIGAGVSF